MSELPSNREVFVDSRGREWLRHELGEGWVKLARLATDSRVVELEAVVPRRPIIRDDALHELWLEDGAHH